MVALSQAAGARVILAGIQIPPNYGPRYTGPFSSQYLEIAEDMALPLIPFLIDGIAQQPELMQDDGIHPKAEAQGMVLEKVENAPPLPPAPLALFGGTLLLLATLGGGLAAARRQARGGGL